MADPTSVDPDATTPGVAAAGSAGNLSAGVAVAVVEADTQLREYLSALLGGGVSPFASLEEVVPRLTGLPVVLVLGPTCAERAFLEGVERLFRAHPEASSVLIAQELTTELLQQALRVGVRDVLSLPIDQGHLLAAVQKVASDVRATARPTGPQEIVEEFDDEEGGRIITVFSTKGGSGKSMIASNLAVLLAERSDRPVCLVDADLQFGDIGVMLKLSPHHTIVDAVGASDRLDGAMIQSLLSQHEESGLYILPAPLEPAFADQVTAGEIVSVLEVLRRTNSHIIVDTPAYFNDVVLGLIEISDDVLLVAGMDIPNIKNVKIGLQTLQLLNTPPEKLRLVLNRANSKVKLDVSEVERTLQLTADALIPSDVVVPQSVNKGVPVVLDAPRSNVAKSLGELADLFIPSGAKRRRR